MYIKNKQQQKQKKGFYLVFISTLFIFPSLQRLAFDSPEAVHLAYSRLHHLTFRRILLICGICKGNYVCSSTAQL